MLSAHPVSALFHVKHTRAPRTGDFTVGSNIVQGDDLISTYAHIWASPSRLCTVLVTADAGPLPPSCLVHWHTNYVQPSPPSHVDIRDASAVLAWISVESDTGGAGTWAMPDSVIAAIRTVADTLSALSE